MFGLWVFTGNRGEMSGSTHAASLTRSVRILPPRVKYHSFFPADVLPVWMQLALSVRLSVKAGTDCRKFQRINPNSL
jgi:hypothetical protein